MRRIFTIAAFLCAIAFMSGCQVRSTVRVDANSNGSGSLSVVARLDKEAARAIPDLAHQLQTSDLVKAGWSVDGPNATDDGGAVVTAKHSFDSPQEANELFRELSGNGPPFQNFQLTQKRSLTHVDTAFSGTVDLRQGVNSFGDIGLTQSMGSRLGFDPNEVQKSLNVNWATTFPVDVVAHLPGGSTTHVPATDKNNTWHATYASADSFKATASGTNTRPLMFFGLAIAALVACVLLLMIWEPEKYNPIHSRKAGGIRAKDLLRLDDSQ